MNHHSNFRIGAQNIAFFAIVIVFLDFVMACTLEECTLADKVRSPFFGEGSVEVMGTDGKQSMGYCLHKFDYGIFERKWQEI